MRLVSLLPSATEIIHALGLGDDLARVRFECDEPPAARAQEAIVAPGQRAGVPERAAALAGCGNGFPS